MSKATFDDLPNELLSKVVKELADQAGCRENLCSLRLVCKRIEPIARRHLFEGLCIMPWSYSPNRLKCKDILETIATCSTNPYAFTEDLTINLSRDAPENKPLSEFENVLEQQLFPALATLTNLRSLTWYLSCPTLLSNATTSILQCITSISMLQKVTMHIDNLKLATHEFSLTSLRNLTSIEIVFHTWTSEDSHWFPEIPNLVLRCPGLEYLLVHLPSDRLAPPVYLRQLLPTEPSLPLRELNLDSVIITPEDFIHNIRHFQQLESLAMLGNTVDAYDAVSAALLATGILLKRVSCCIDNRRFLDYIDSYSGAHRLQIEINGDHSLPPPQSPDILRRLFHSSIPKHRESLRELRLVILGRSTRPDISWSNLLDRDQLAELVHCRCLRKLYIEIRGHSLYFRLQRCPDVEFWLKVALQLPQLSLLHVVFVTWSTMGLDIKGLSFISDFISDFKKNNALRCDVLFDY